MATFTLTGTIRRFDTTPIAGARIKILPRLSLYADPGADITYIKEVYVICSKTGYFTANLITGPNVAYTVVGYESATGYQSETFTAPSAGTTIDLSDVQPLAITPALADLYVKGPQGPPGDDHVFVSTTPPPNPEVNDVWIQI